jgi:hypothetical protein
MTAVVAGRGVYSVNLSSMKVRDNLYRYSGKRTLDSWFDGGMHDLFLEEYHREPVGNAYLETLANPYMADGILLDPADYIVQGPHPRRISAGIPIPAMKQGERGASPWDTIVSLLSSTSFWKLPVMKPAGTGDAPALPCVPAR